MKKIINWFMILATVFAVFAMTFSTSFAANAFQPEEGSDSSPVANCPECICTAPECLEAQGMSAKGASLVSKDLDKIQKALIEMSKKLKNEASLGGVDAPKLEAIQQELSVQNEQIFMLMNNL